MQRFSATLKTAASTCFTLAALIAGCALLPPDAGEDRISGHYELSKYLARGPADGLYDAMEEDSVRVEMTLTESRRVKGRWYGPNYKIFENDPPKGKREVYFQGDYSVSRDTITIDLDDGYYDIPGRKWLYRSDTLFNLTIRSGAWPEYMELTKTREQ